jgi:hypothetical protein
MKSPVKLVISSIYIINQISGLRQVSENDVYKTEFLPIPINMEDE